MMNAELTNQAIAFGFYSSLIVFILSATSLIVLIYALIRINKNECIGDYYKERAAFYTMIGITIMFLFLIIYPSFDWFQILIAPQSWLIDHYPELISPCR